MVTPFFCGFVLYGGEEWHTRTREEYYVRVYNYFCELLFTRETFAFALKANSPSAV